MTNTARHTPRSLGQPLGYDRAVLRHGRSFRPAGVGLLRVGVAAPRDRLGPLERSGVAERGVGSLIGGSTRAGWDCSLVRSTIGEPNRSSHGEGHVHHAGFEARGGSLRGTGACQCACCWKRGRPVIDLHALDRAIARRACGELVRYAHDVVVLCCRMRDAAEAALEPAGEILVGPARKLRPDQAKVVDVKMGREGI